LDFSFENKPSGNPEGHLHSDIKMVLRFRVEFQFVEHDNAEKERKK
jgi:hypothetical protein